MTSPRQVSHARRLVLALAAMSLASAAGADGLRIRVGDLTRPSAARDFEQRLDSAARRFCFARYRPNELDQIGACQAAIREEGLAELSPEQRDALAHSLGAGRQLANASR